MNITKPCYGKPELAGEHACDVCHKHMKEACWVKVENARLEAEAQWLAMRLGYKSVPGNMPMAKKQETRARYWREAARKGVAKEQGNGN